jgi:hypothetical protein
MGMIINGQAIDSATIQQEVDNLRPEYEKAFSEMETAEREHQLYDWAQENVVERTLLQQAAEKREDLVLADEELQSALAKLKESVEDPKELCQQMNCATEAELEKTVALSLKTEKFVEEIRSQTPAPSKEQIEEYYQEHQQDLKTPESVTCAHIVKHVNWQCNEAQAQEAIQQAKAELDQGTAFAAVAGKCSDCPDNGGSLGQIQRGQMVEEFEDIIFNLGPGQFSDIFQTRFGYHIATVYEHQASSVAPLEDVRDDILKMLHEQVKADSVYAFIDTLKDKASIEKPDS